MKIFTPHFILLKDSDYQDLSPIFAEILKVVLEECGQMPEEDEIFHMFVDANTVDLDLNRKPEGYNRKGKVRIIFPTDRKEFYIKTFSKAIDLKHITYRVEVILENANISFKTTTNDNVEF